MSSSSTGSEQPPREFAAVNPVGDLSSHRNSIAYALGEINSEIRHLSEKIVSGAGDLGKLRESTESDLKEVKASLKKIEDKVLVTETQVTTAFYSSKWFLAAIMFIIGAIATNWSLLGKLLNLVH